MDLDNIFSTMDHNERNPLKDSELKKELEELFRSECLGIEEDPENEEQLISEFAGVLNEG